MMYQGFRVRKIESKELGATATGLLADGLKTEWQNMCVRAIRVV